MARYSFHDYQPDPDNPNYIPWWQKALAIALLLAVGAGVERCTSGSW